MKNLHLMLPYLPQHPFKIDHHKLVKNQYYCHPIIITNNINIDVMDELASLSFS